MSTVRPYPHYEINVIDNSIYTILFDEVLPIHRPVYVMKTQEGPSGIPVWCENYSKFAKTFGSETLNEGNKKYFSPQAFFLKNTFTYNGAFVVRATDASAKKAICILEAHVVALDAENGIVQYVKDEAGKRVTNEEGEYIPIMDDPNETPSDLTDDVARKEAGVEITYKVRYAKLVNEENLGFDELQVRTLEDGITKVYPLLVFESLYAGEYGDDLAFQLFYKTKENDSFDVANAGSVFSTLAPLRRDYNNSTTTSHRDIYNGINQSFCVKPEVIDPITGISSSMNVILEKAYAGPSMLPYTIYSYPEHFKLVGNRVIEVEGDEILGFEKEEGFDVVTSEQGYLVNIYNLMNTANEPYDHVVFGDASANDVVSLTEGYNIFLSGGDDGSLSDVTVENAVRAFCKLTLCPEAEDEFKYPFTHMYDVGFTAKTKFAMLDFLDLRQDVAVELSTQVLFEDGTGASISLNDQMDDESLGEVLRAYALLMRESIAKGTECCRASIYTQAGFPVAPTYNKPVPCTFWSAVKHAEYHNLPYMTGQEPRGWPYSYNELFKGDLNWVPYDKNSRSRLWDNGFNYCMSADMSRIFYPALRSVYRYDTSALVDQWFVDAIVYMKHEIRKSWGKHSGRNDYSDILHSDITKDLQNKIGTLFGGKYRFTIRVYQTAEEAKIGYVNHVTVGIEAPNTNRVWDVDVVVGREGLNTEEA